MAPRVARTDGGGSAESENIAFVRHMLAELRLVAEKEGADLLCYLIEMAYVEAGDIQSSIEARSLQHGKRY